MMDVWSERNLVLKGGKWPGLPFLSVCPFARLPVCCSASSISRHHGSLDMLNSRSFFTTCVPCMTTHRGTCGLGGTRAQAQQESSHSQIETPLMMWGRARVKWAPRE